MVQACRKSCSQRQHCTLCGCRDIDSHFLGELICPQSPVTCNVSHGNYVFLGELICPQSPVTCNVSHGNYVFLGELICPQSPVTCNIWAKVGLVYRLYICPRLHFGLNVVIVICWSADCLSKVDDDIVNNVLDCDCPNRCTYVPAWTMFSHACLPTKTYHSHML